MQPIASALSNSPVCIGNTIRLSGGPNGMASYSWTGPNGFSSNLQNPTITNATSANSGTHTLTISDGYCSDEASTEVTVRRCETPTPIPTFGGGAFPIGATTQCTETLTVDLIGNVTTVSMTPQGILCEKCLASDPTGTISWEADAGTKLVLSNSKIPKLIKLTVAQSKPQAKETIIGEVYDLNAYDNTHSIDPNPISINPAARFAIPYNPDELPPNTTEVVLAYYNTEYGWLEVEDVSGAVAEVGKARGALTHFTYFAVLAKTSTEGSVDFVISDLNIIPNKISVNETAIATVIVANNGTETGSYDVQLIIDGKLISSKKITIHGGNRELVNFSINNNTPGKHYVEIAGLKGEFEVVSGNSFNWWIIGLIAGLLIIAIIIGLLAKLRKG